jgi:PAS domain S-box-containing protein
MGDGIIERKRIEKALLESEERYRAFFKTSRDCVFITSVDGRWVDLNDAAVQFFGYGSKEDLLKVEINDLYANPDERTRHLQVIKEKGYTQEYPVILRKKDGTIIYTLITSVIRKDGTGRIIGYQGTIRDITERKRAEEELTSEKERLEVVTQNIGAGLAVISRDYRTLWANKVLRDIFGECAGNVCYTHYNQREKICPGCGVRDILEAGQRGPFMNRWVGTQPVTSFGLRS